MIQGANTSYELAQKTAGTACGGIAAIDAFAKKIGLPNRIDQALHLFVELFGSETGNMVLNYMALGGAWLGGGIVVKILEHIKATDHFMSGFTSKGRLSDVMRRVPVRVILNDKTALLGAAKHAFDLLG